jgi:hypothetical protein
VRRHSQRAVCDKHDPEQGRLEAEELREEGDDCRPEVSAAASKKAAERLTGGEKPCETGEAASARARLSIKTAFSPPCDGVDAKPGAPAEESCRSVSASRSTCSVSPHCSSSYGADGCGRCARRPARRPSVSASNAESMLATHLLGSDLARLAAGDDDRRQSNAVGDLRESGGQRVECRRDNVAAKRGVDDDARGDVDEEVDGDEPAQDLRELGRAGTRKASQASGTGLMEQLALTSSSQRARAGMPCASRTRERGW